MCRYRARADLRRSSRANPRLGPGAGDFDGMMLESRTHWEALLVEPGYDSMRDRPQAMPACSAELGVSRTEDSVPEITRYGCSADGMCDCCVLPSVPGLASRLSTSKGCRSCARWSTTMSAT